MFFQSPFARMERPSLSSESVKSAIVNCICPGCGGPLSLRTQQFRCQGRCGTDWRPVWMRMRQCEPLVQALNIQCKESRLERQPRQDGD